MDVNAGVVLNMLLLTLIAFFNLRFTEGATVDVFVPASLGDMSGAIDFTQSAIFSMASDSRDFLLV